MNLFFGNKDIKILQKLAKLPFEGKLDYPWLITNECDIPETLIFDYDSIQKFEEYLAENSLEAPQLVKSLKVAFSQKDKNGNIIAPNCNYIAVLGIDKSLESQDFYDTLETTLATSEYFFYALGFVQPTVMGMKWANTYPKRILPFFAVATDTAIAEDSKGKVRVHFDKDNQMTHIAEMAQFVFPVKFAPLKFMSLTGMNSYNKTDGEVNLLDDKGIAVYRDVNRTGEVSNSIGTDKKYLDTMYILDTIVYNLAGSISKMLKEDNVFDDNVITKILRISNEVFSYVGDNLNMVSRNADGSLMYSVLTPRVDGKVRGTRKYRGIKWKFIAKTPIEFVEGTAEQVLDETELEITFDDLEGVSL